MLDVALARNPATGRHTLVWDDFGDLVFDEIAVYPVLTTIVTRKGQYYWDATGEQGTYLHTVRQDAFATGSQLRAHVQDGLDQCQAESITTKGSVEAERIRTGIWVTRPTWRPAGHDRDVVRELRT